MYCWSPQPDLGIIIAHPETILTRLLRVSSTLRTVVMQHYDLSKLLGASIGSYHLQHYFHGKIASDQNHQFTLELLGCNHFQYGDLLAPFPYSVIISKIPVSL